MKYICSVLLFTTTILFGQSSLRQKVTVNPAAKKYYDLAIDSAYANGDQGLMVAIGFLNKAIRIDKYYFNAYNNKFIFQNQLKQYDNAIVTGRQMIKLRPKNVDIIISVGDIYEIKGDTITSMQYFNKALPIYNALLDTMKTTNKSYKTTLVGKAINLILLKQPDKGKAILTELYYKEPDNNLKQLYRHFAAISRKDLIDDNAAKPANVQ